MHKLLHKSMPFAAIFIITMVVFGSAAVALAQESFDGVSIGDIVTVVSQDSTSTSEPVAESVPVSDPVLTTDKADYHPGETVSIFGSFFEVFQRIILNIFGMNEDGSEFVGPALDVTADEQGAFTTTYTLENIYRPLYTVIASALDGTLLAQTTFTDAPDPAISYDKGVYRTDQAKWTTGNAGSGYEEGDWAYYTYAINGLNGSSVGGDTVPDFNIVFNHYQSATDAIFLDAFTNFRYCWDCPVLPDGTAFPAYLDTAWKQWTPSNINKEYSGSICSSTDSEGDGPAQFHCFSGIASQFSDGLPSAGNNHTLRIFYESHLARSIDWLNGNESEFEIGESNQILPPTEANPQIVLGEEEYDLWALPRSGVGFASGSSRHFNLQDQSAGPSGAITLPIPTVAAPSATLTIVKDAQPDSAQDFSFTGTLAAFLLDDDADGTLSNTKVFTQLAAGTYSVAEGPVSGWVLSSATCSDGSPVSAIVLGEGESVTCTFVNVPDTGTLIVKKHVLNTNGGTKTASDFTLHVKSGGVDVAGSPAAGSESGTSYTLNAGSYVVSEDFPLPAGYNNVLIDGDCDSSGNVTVVAGETKTCTITNHNTPPVLTLNKVVVNDNGGTALESAWTLSATGTATPLSGPGAAGSTDVVSDSTFMAGTYTLSESSGPSGYSASSWVCTGGGVQSGDQITLEVGEVATCTITNDDAAPSLTIIKNVINDNGGTAGVGDWTLTATGPTSISGPGGASSDSSFDQGTYTLSETSISGYSASAWSCTGTGTQTGNQISLDLGESAACQITNDDQQAYITVVKAVTNDNGGSANPDDSNLTLEGNAVLSGVAVPVNPGTYTAAETLLPGYTFEGFTGDCDANGDTTVALGESKTCTLTNNDQQAYMIVDKTVVNDNGGTAQPNDFLLTIDGNAVLDEVAYPVNPGAHVTSETPMPGYAAGSWGGDCDVTGNVSVALGETKTCTITNDDVQPLLMVTKVVVNNNGGTITSSSFPLFVNATSVASGVQNGFNAGTYTVSETQQAGYTFVGITGDCAADGTITLNVGDVKSCTVINDDLPATLKITKDAQPDDLKDFTFMRSFGANFLLDDDANCTVTDCGLNPDVNQPQSMTFGNLNAGSYTVTENVPGFWLLNAIACMDVNTQQPFPVVVNGSSMTVVLGLAESVECTFVNAKPSPTRTLGFWQTHTVYTSSVFAASPLNSSMLIGDGGFHKGPVDTIGKIFGAFYSSISKKTVGGNRSDIDKARMQLLQQLVAAKLNCAAFGCALSDQATITAADAAYAGTSISAILSSASLLDAFNNSGDTLIIGNAGKATPKTSQSLADKAFWDAP